MLVDNKKSLLTSFSFKIIIGGIKNYGKTKRRHQQKLVQRTKIWICKTSNGCCN